jgi:hypothetical protein
MHNVATISKELADEHVKAAWENFSVWNFPSRFRRFIETADWDKGCLFNQVIDSASLYLLIAAFICLLFPIALSFM